MLIELAVAFYANKISFIRLQTIWTKSSVKAIIAFIFKALIFL